MEIIDGKVLAQNVRENLKSEVEELKKRGISPKFAVILVGNDKASLTYVKSKNKACRELGIECEEKILNENTNMEELLGIIDDLNKRKDISGILLQSPIPTHLDINEAFKRIAPEKDVDGFNPCNVGKLCLNQDTFVSCTPYGIMRMFEAYNIPLDGKSAVVIGRSNIVGKPMALSLLNKNATVTICHSKTQDLKEITKKADIVIAAIGKKHFVTDDMVKERSSCYRCWNK
jgi:methylenetetrahydrofolate dehydrogenase (NADP+)/methenyltetrahydrofolate cyclohydrolase